MNSWQILQCGCSCARFCNEVCHDSFHGNLAVGGFAIILFCNNCFTSGALHFMRRISAGEVPVAPLLQPLARRSSRGRRHQGIRFFYHAFTIALPLLQVSYFYATNEELILQLVR